jgi:hypothetical protein
MLDIDQDHYAFEVASGAGRYRLTREGGRYAIVSLLFESWSTRPTPRTCH